MTDTKNQIQSLTQCADAIYELLDQQSSEDHKRELFKICIAISSSEKNEFVDGTTSNTLLSLYDFFSALPEIEELRGEG